MLVLCHKVDLKVVLWVNMLSCVKNDFFFSLGGVSCR